MKNLKIVKILILFIIQATFVNAQTNKTLVDEFEAGSHTFQGVTLPYRIFTPKNYEPNKSYPIVLCLHGAGERGTDNVKNVIKHDLGVSWAKEEVQSKYPCFILVPQCPEKMKWNYVNFGQGSFSIDSLSVGKELLTTIDLLDSLIQKYNINEKRQYVTGLSMGGYGTWDLITRYPNRFAAAVPMSGAGDPTKVKLFKNLPIWFFHNTNDKIVPVTGSRDMLQGMKAQSLKVFETQGKSLKEITKKIKKSTRIYTEASQGNHGPWEIWFNDPNLHNWLFSQTKK